MKKLLYALVLMFFLTTESYASNLQSVCANRGTFISNKKISTYSANAINNRVSIGTEKDDKFYNIAMSNNSARFFFDLAKIARNTGRRVNLCVDGNYLLGIEWFEL
ncbi:TPA: hypothetical protein ACVO0S_001536 [Vibrio alginolyticus]